MPIAIEKRLRALRPDRPQGSALRIVPIIGESQTEPQYELLTPKTLPHVSITEISESGSVPALKVTNRLECMLYLVDGQELVGAKQNRILNTDVLVPAASELQIPVSCVEQGRWGYRGRSFTPGKSASSRIRSAKLARVHQSLKQTGAHAAGQGQVWAEVEQTLAAAASNSATNALSDAYAKRDAELQSLRKGFQLPLDAVGLAFFHGGDLRGIDVFDRASTLAAYWPTLLDSYAIDWLDLPPLVQPQSGGAELAAIDSAFTLAADGAWEKFPSPGAGSDWRLVTADYSGSALAWDDQSIIHLQLFPQMKP